MRKVAALSLTLALGACVQTGGSSAGQGMAAPIAPLRVTNEGQPYTMYQGGAARKQADAICAARGQSLRPSIYDRFEAGAWIYRGGCA